MNSDMDVFMLAGSCNTVCFMLHTSPEETVQKEVIAYTIVGLKRAGIFNSRIATVVVFSTTPSGQTHASVCNGWFNPDLLYLNPPVDLLERLLRHCLTCPRTELLCGALIRRTRDTEQPLLKLALFESNLHRLDAEHYSLKDPALFTDTPGGVITHVQFITRRRRGALPVAPSLTLTIDTCTACK